MANLKDTLVLGKLTVTDSIIADKFKGPLEGNATTATKFNTSRTFSFAGDVSGTVTTDFASGFEVSLSVLDNSHSHTYDNITNLDTPLTNYLNTAKEYTDDKIAALINSSPEVLNTLNELAAALGNDPNFATTVADNIATKLPKTGGTMTGAITFNASTVDAIKYAGSKNTYTMIKFIDNTTDANGNGIIIGGGGSVYIGSGESAANLYSALSTPSGGDEAIHISGDSTIKFYSNCQTIANRKETTYNADGSWNFPGQIAATQLNGSATKIALNGIEDSTTYGTYGGIIQSSGGGPETNSWHNSIKILHNNSSGYYTQLAHNFTGSHGLWHRSCRGGVISNWIKILDSNNYQGTLDNTYLQLTGGTMTGGLTVNGKATFVGGVDIRGSAADKLLVVRGIVGSDGSGVVDDLYLQYGANKLVHFGNTGSYTISADGAHYTGNAATATKWATARTLTIGATGKSIDGTTDVAWTPYEMRVTRAQYNIGSNMNQIADHGCELGMANLSGTDTTVNPNGGTSWHHYINMTWSDANDNNGTTNNEWCTQIANKAGTTDLWVRSRSGGSITDGSAWVAPWTRILTGSNWTSVVDGRYLKLDGGGTMTGTPVIKFPASAGTIATNDPMAITYGRISAYGTLCINADSDNSSNEYIILTAGKGLSGSAADGLAIGQSTLTWQNKTILNTDNVSGTAGYIPKFTAANSIGNGWQIKNQTAAGSSDWTNTTTDGGLIPTMNTIAYWNGAYSDAGGSNLAYCNQGAFGSMATKNVAAMNCDILFSNSGTTFRQIQGVVGDNDYWRIGGGATASNGGYMEIATADDGNEPIYVRQYTGAYTTLTRTATLLDASGNTIFPGAVTVGLHGTFTYNTSDKCIDVIFN